MDAFPAFFRLAGRTVVIAGSGPAAEAKVRLFETSPARVVRLANKAAFSSKAYDGASLAFIASDDPAFVEAAAAAARAAHVPVNVVDRPDLCDFTTPALIDRGSVVAAVGTDGAAPIFATLLRQDIEARVPEGAGRVAALLSAMQSELRQALPDLVERRAFLRTVLNGPTAEAAMAGDMETAKVRFREALAKGVALEGRVSFVDGAGPAERLTLAASRTLAAADVLVLDEGVSPEVVGLARRDADRLTEATPEHLAELAHRGRHVVRVAVGAPKPSELRELAELGVDVQIAPHAD